MIGRTSPFHCAILILGLLSCAWAQVPVTLRQQMGIQGLDTLGAPGFEPELLLLKDLGFRHVRVHDRWESIRPRPEAPNDWRAFDPMMANCRRFEVEPMILLAYGVPWASNAPAGTSDNWALRTYPPDVAAYAAHARDWARRFRSQPIAFEIWNEPNGSNLFWKGSPEAYAEMMRAAYVAIKGVDPTIPVSMAGPAGSDLSYVENLLLNLGGDPYSDAVAIHPYGLKPEEFPLLIEKMHRIADRGKTPKQIWLTEWGFFSEHHPQVSREDQQSMADRYVRATLLSLLAGVNRNYTFCLLREPALAIAEVKEGKPVVRPTFEAMKKMMSAVGDLPLVGTLRGETDIYALVFRAAGAEKATIAYWTSGSPRQVSVPRIPQLLLVSSQPQYLASVAIADSAVEPAKAVGHSLAPPSIPLEGWIEAPTSPQLVGASELSALKIRGRINNNLDRPVDAELRLKTPEAWNCSTPSVNVRLNNYESKWISYDLVPPKDHPPGRVKGIELTGRIEARELPAREVPIEFLPGIGIVAEFQPVRLEKNRLVLPITLHRERRARLTYEVHPGSYYSFGTMRGPVEPGSDRLDLLFKSATAAGDEPVYITLHDGDRAQNIFAISDFPLAVRANQMSLGGDAKEWDRCPPIHIGSAANVPPSMRAAWQGPEDLSATVRAAFNDSGLFLRFDVRDDHVLPNSRDSSQAWNGDCIELFLSPANRQLLPNPQPPRAPDDLQFLVPFPLTAGAKQGQLLDVRFSGGQAEGIVAGKSKKGDVRFGRVDSGFWSEVLIPWSALNGASPHLGATLGLDIALDDDDTGVGRKLQMQWRSGLDIISTVRRYATLTLTEPDQLLLPDSAPLSVDFTAIPPIGGTGAGKTTAKLVANPRAGGASAQALHVRLEKGRKYTELELFSSRTPVPAPGFVPKECAIEMKADTAPGRLAVRVQDSQGEVFQYMNTEVLKTGELHRFTLPIDFQTSWGGNQDHKIDLPLRSLTLVLEHLGDDDARDFIFSEISFR